MNAVKHTMVEKLIYKCKSQHCKTPLNADIYFRYQGFCPQCAVHSQNIPGIHRLSEPARDSLTPKGNILLISLFLESKHHTDINQQLHLNQQIITSLKHNIPASLLAWNPTYQFQYVAPGYTRQCMKQTMMQTCQLDKNWYGVFYDNHRINFYFKPFNIKIPGFSNSGTLAVAYSHFDTKFSINPLNYLQDSLIPGYIDTAESLDRSKYRNYHNSIQQLIDKQNYRAALLLCHHLRAKYPEYGGFYTHAAYCENTAAKRSEIYYGLLYSSEKALMCSELANENEYKFIYKDSAGDLVDALKWNIRACVLQLNSGYLYVATPFIWLAWVCRYLGCKDMFVLLYQFACQAKFEESGRLSCRLHVDQKIKRQCKKAAWYLRYAIDSFALTAIGILLDTIKVKKPLNIE